jgi:hypothetical protein
MAILRGLSLLFLVLGGAMLAVGVGGFADDWIAANASCGDQYNSHACAPGEAQMVLKLVGGIFVGIALVELAVVVVWSRSARIARRAIAASPAASTSFQSGWSAQPPAPFLPVTPAPQPTPAGGDGLVDRLARLADLRDRGVLSDEEFQAQKARLL